jgi:hypothetical protein
VNLFQVSGSVVSQVRRLWRLSFCLSVAVARAAQVSAVVAVAVSLLAQALSVKTPTR